MCDELSIPQDGCLSLADGGFSHEVATRQTRAQAPLQWTSLFVGSNRTSSRPLVLDGDGHGDQGGDNGLAVAPQKTVVARWLGVEARSLWPADAFSPEESKPEVFVNSCRTNTCTCPLVSHQVLLPFPGRAPPGVRSQSDPERPPRWTPCEAGAAITHT